MNCTLTSSNWLIFLLPDKLDSDAEGLVWDTGYAALWHGLLRLSKNQMMTNCSAGGKWENKNKITDLCGGGISQQEEKSLYIWTSV